MKTSELTGAALNWAVWACEKPDDQLLQMRRKCRPYSTNWAHGGEIIEREGICLWCGDGAWEATIHGEDEPVTQRGNTPLIAAMRCYVASKLGDEVDIPTELTQGETK